MRAIRPTARPNLLVSHQISVIWECEDGWERRRDIAMQRQGREVATVRANTVTRAVRTVVERTPVVEELPPDRFN